MAGRHSFKKRAQRNDSIFKRYQQLTGEQQHHDKDFNPFDIIFDEFKERFPELTKDAVRSAVRRRTAGHLKYHGNAKLTNRQEILVLGIIRMFKKVNQPLTIPEMKQTVRDVFSLGPSWDADHWWPKFKKRHSKHIRVENSKVITRARVRSNTQEDVEAWLDKLEIFLSEVGCFEKQLFNLDEKLISFSNLGSTKATISEHTHIQNITAGKRESTPGSMLILTNVDANIRFVMYVLKRDSPTSPVNIPTHHIPKSKDVYTSVYYMFTQTGMLDSVAFQDALQCFRKFYSTIYPGMEPYIILDNKPAHLNVAVIKSATEQNIHLFFLLPNTTHFAQPLDCHVFRNVSQKLRRFRHVSSRSHASPQPRPRGIASVSNASSP